MIQEAEGLCTHITHKYAGCMHAQGTHGHNSHLFSLCFSLCVSLCVCPSASRFNRSKHLNNPSTGTRIDTRVSTRRVDGGADILQPRDDGFKTLQNLRFYAGHVAKQIQKPNTSTHYTAQALAKTKTKTLAPKRDSRERHIIHI